MSDIEEPREPGSKEPEISVNAYDGAVAVEEADRTVFLSEKDTIVVEKSTEIDIAPANRPRKVYGGMWGPTEIAVVGAASLAVLAALIAWFVFALPAKRALERNLSTRDRLEAELASARAKYGDITSTEAQVAKLVTSVTDFESNYLPAASNGRTALYQKLNGLISGYGLVNTTGPDYAPLEIVDTGSANESAEERGRSRFRSLFPGTYVTMTLEGPYANLRRFIRDIETGNDFVVISSVELEPSDSQPTNAAAGTEQASTQASGTQRGNFPAGFGGIPVAPSARQLDPMQQVRRPTGRTLGQVVSLRLEMAAYFRRSAAAVPEPNTAP